MGKIPGSHSVNKIAASAKSARPKNVLANKEKQSEQPDFDFEKAERDLKAARDLNADPSFLANNEKAGDAKIGNDLPWALKYSNLKEVIRESNRHELQEYMRRQVKPWLESGVRAGDRYLYIALAGEYSFIEACAGLSDKQKLEMLGWLGGGRNVKVTDEGWFQKAILQVLHPLPPRGLVKPKERKKAQNVIYTYDLAFDGARAYGILPDEFADALRQYSIQGLADYGRVQNSLRKEEQARSAKIKGGERSGDLEDTAIDEAPYQPPKSPSKRRALGLKGKANKRHGAPPKSVKLSAAPGSCQVKVKDEVTADFNARGRKVCVVDDGVGAPVVSHCWPVVDTTRAGLRALRLVIFRALLADAQNDPKDDPVADSDADDTWDKD